MTATLAGLSFTTLFVSVGATGGMAGCPCIDPHTSTVVSGFDNYVSDGKLRYVQPGTEVQHLYPYTYGQNCLAHDNGQPPACNNDVRADWCSRSWCYVDEANCVGYGKVKSAYFPRATGLFFSYETCGGSDGSILDNNRLLIERADNISATSRQVLEESAKAGQSVGCTLEPGRNMCPCDSCIQNRIWGDAVDTAEVGTKSGPDGSSTEKEAAICMAEQLRSTYLATANSEQDSDFTQTGYLYFADDETGTYSQWPKSDACSWSGGRYDPRFRPWFAAGATGPKDVLIVVDVSGSMRSNANRHEKAKAATKHILDTLTWKDFVGVVLFNDEIAGYYWDLMVTATDANKKLINEWMELQDWGKGGTNFRPAFDKAFQIIRDSVSEGRTAMCQKAIMFLTDGEASFSGGDYDFVKTSSERYDVIVFGYALGGGADKRITKNLACQNRGVFYPVRDNEDLSGIMARYFEYFAQGQQMCMNSFVAYTATQGSNLFAACMPMYDRSAPTRSFMGVTCLDMQFLENITRMRQEPGWEHFVCQATDRTKMCQALDLSECQRQKIRRSFSSESVCMDNEFSDASESTSCPCQVLDCEDDPNFIDELDYFCDTWVGDPCDFDKINALGWGYTFEGIQEVRRKCKKSCGLCETEAVCSRSTAGSCSQVPVETTCRACRGKVSGMDLDGNFLDCPAGSQDDMAVWREKQRQSYQRRKPPSTVSEAAQACAAGTAMLALVSLGMLY